MIEHSRICDGVGRYYLPDMGVQGCYCFIRGLHLSCVRHLETKYRPVAGYHRTSRADLIPMARTQRNMLRHRRTVVDNATDLRSGGAKKAQSDPSGPPAARDLTKPPRVSTPP
jgi:hypothetical protein